MSTETRDALREDELVTLARMRLDLDRFEAFRADDVRVLLDIIDRLDAALRATDVPVAEGLRERIEAVVADHDGGSGQWHYAKHGGDALLNDLLAALAKP